MKRLIDDADEIEKTETLVAYLERKLEKKKAHLGGLKKREKRNLLQVNLFNTYVGDERQAVLVLKDSENHDDLMTSGHSKSETVVSQHPVLLTYMTWRDNDTDIVKLVRLRDAVVDGADVDYKNMLIRYAISDLTKLVQAERRERNPTPVAATEPVEKTVAAVVCQAWSDAKVASYWRGPYDCLVSSAVESVPGESPCSRYFSDGDWERCQLKKPHECEAELDKEAWLERFARFSPSESLWFYEEKKKSV
jgi:hypothetical protein